MIKLITCGNFNKKYIYIIILYIIMEQAPFWLLQLLVFNNLGKDKKRQNEDNNILFMPLMTYFGQSLYLIPEFIIKKYDFKETSYINRNSERKSLALELIFNEYSDTIEKIDIFYICLVSLLILVVDFVKTTIYIKNKEYAKDFIFNQEYNCLQLIFLFIFSIYVHKTKFYKHQYCPFFCIIIIGIIRYIIKLCDFYINFYEVGDIFLNLLYQILIAMSESFNILYSKGLMKYKYFSIYKACYVFGIINTFLLFIILFIISFIKCNPSLIICSLYYNGNYYIDNIFNIFSKYNWYQFIIIFFCCIFFGATKILINSSISNFTIFHIFLLYQIAEFYEGIIQEINAKTNKITIYIVLSSYIIEIFLILVFLEVLELKFCNLNKNVKKNIQKRAFEDAKLLGDNENIFNLDGSSVDFSEEEEEKFYDNNVNE